MQKNALKLPTYSIVDAVGEQHDQEFTVECAISDQSITSLATAKSRRLAEQKAAADVLEQFHKSRRKTKP